MATFEETETTVSGIQADKCYYIGTNRAKHITRLDKEDRAELVSTQGEWREYRVQATDFDPLRGFKVRRAPMSEEQKDVLRERLAQARK